MKRFFIFAVSLHLLAFASCLASAESDSAAFAQAEKLFLQGRYERVVLEADKLIDSKRDGKGEALYLKALSQLKLGIFKDARESFGGLVLKLPKSKMAFDAYIGIGDAYFLGGDINAAINAYQDILNRYPNDKNISAVYYRMGDCFKKAGSDDKAEVYFNKVRTLSPSSFEARMIPGLVLSKVPQGASKGCFSIQVGCFKNRKNAEKFVSKLSKEGFGSFMEPPRDSSDKLYKVKVGRLDSKKEAEVLASRLKARGYSTKACD